MGASFCVEQEDVAVAAAVVNARAVWRLAEGVVGAVAVVDAGADWRLAKGTVVLPP